MNFKIVGNFDFIKDSHDIIQRFGVKTSTETFLENMMELKEVANQVQTPLIFITLPDKAKYLDLAQSDKFHIEGRMSNQLGKALKNSVDCLNVDKLMSENINAPTFDEFYFKTDVHCTSYGEFWLAKMLAEHLKDSYHINFPDAQQVFDLNQYNRTEYEFVGNTARSVGEYFVGTDKFEIYKPNYETNLKLINPSSFRREVGFL